MKSRFSLSSFAVLLFLGLLFIVPFARAASFSMTGQTAGATPFLADIRGSLTPVGALKSVQFTIAPKAGSVTRPITAISTAGYLASRGDFDPATGSLVIPVFGLYANYANTVSLTFTFTDNTVQQLAVAVTTPAWADPCSQFDRPTVMQARTTSTSLSYDYFLVKNDCGSESPVLMDTDGAVRWVGTAGGTSHASMYFANGIYLSVRPPNSSHPTGLARMEFDGTMTFLQDYASLGVTSTGHHNFDPGKRGILMEVDTTSQIESVIIEVDALGHPLKTWDMAAIIAAAMTAGGEDPIKFVKSAPNDWFHNNAATYRASDDSLIVSSRENFVIALDYETGAIKWILGDSTKEWYQYPSLRKYALNLSGNSLPPIGQHAVSFTKDDSLLLFDDGQNSGSHTPAGTERNYSTPRKYQLDLTGGSANELWNYTNRQPLFSYICSSVYEDAAANYLIDYASIVNQGNSAFAELVGLGAAGDRVFDYRYATTFCSTAWNAIPIHLESMVFATIDAVSAVSRKVHGPAGAFDVNLPLTGTPGIEGRSGGPSGDYQVVLTFAKPVTVSAATVAEKPGSGGRAAVLGEPIVTGNQVTVNLTQVGASDRLVIQLFGVNDGTNLGASAVPMNVVLGDCNGDQVVNNADLRGSKGRSAKRLTNANFRNDVNVDGVINKADQALVRANLGRVLGP